MKNVELGFEVVPNEKTLDEYTEKIKEQEHSTVEWRYPSYTAMNGEESFVARIYNRKIQSYLLVPHFWDIPRRKKSIIRKPQPLHELIRVGLQKEVHLFLKKWQRVQTIEVENTNPLVEIDVHQKHIVDIIKYGKYDWRYRDFQFFPSNFDPVWVHRSVLPFIFKKVTLVGGEQKRHAQYDIYTLLTERFS